MIGMQCTHTLSVMVSNMFRVNSYTELDNEVYINLLYDISLTIYKLNKLMNFRNFKNRLAIYSLIKSG